MITSYKKARHAAPSDLSTFKKFTAVAVIGLAAAVSVFSAASDGKTAYITDGDKQYTVAADSTDIGAVLNEAGITLGDLDETIVTEQSGDIINIDIKRAFDVTVAADGSEKTVGLTGGTVADALEKAGVELHPNDTVTPSVDEELSENTQVKVVRGVKIYLVRGGETKLKFVPEGTVGDALKAVGCELCIEGNKGIKNSTKVTNGMKLCVDEVLYRTTTKTEKVEPTVVEKACATLPLGEKTVKQEGKQGKLERSYKEKYVNGELVEKKEDKVTVVVKPENKVVLVGTQVPEVVEVTTDSDDKENTSSVSEEKDKTPAASGNSVDSDDFGKASDDDGTGFSYSTLISGVCTAYNEVNGITATGTTPQVGTVAVDPNVIPYGTRLYIASADGSFVYGYAIAEDTGDACMAGDIVVDLYMNSEAECNDFGRQELNIYILD